MYGFPAELDLDSLIGQELNQIRLGPYDIQFVHSGSGTHICVQGAVEVYEDENLIARWDQKCRWTSLEFQRLLGTAPIAWALLGNRLLEMTYDNGLKLHIVDDSDCYETAQIYFDDKSLPTVIV